MYDFKNIVTKFFLFLIRGYQKVISPLLGPRCRYYPTCSDYACGCLNKYPLSQAMLKISWRIARCNPLTPGGVDQP